MPDPSMIRIALIIGQLGLGGAEKQLCLLAEGSLRHSYRPLVISLSAGGEREQDLRHLGIEIVVLPRGGSFNIKRLWRVVKTLRHFRPEIVYGFDYSGSIYGRLAGIITGVPILIGGVRSQWSPPKKVRYIERLLRLKTDAVISNSVAAKLAWSKVVGYPEERITVIPNGFDWTEVVKAPRDFRPLRELLALPLDVPVISCIGGLYDLKNPLMFLDVATSLIGSGTRAQFVWIGDGPMRPSFERVLEERGLKGIVHLLGKRADASWLARDFQIAVLTSNIEGMPNVIAEYMSWGTPVVTTNAGGCSELVEHEITGFIVEKNNAAQMTAYIVKLLDDSSLATAMGRRGQEKLRKEFSAEVMVTRTILVCDNAIVKKKLRRVEIGTPRFERS